MIYVRAALRRDGSDPVVPITSKDPTQVPVVARTTELWLVRHGLPQFMPHYGVRESLHVAVPLLIVIAGFAVASLPWLDLPAEQAPAAAPLLIAVAGCLVPLVRHVRHVLECYETPRSHLTIEVLGWIGALVAIIALYPAPPDIRPVYDAVWVDLVFVLVSLTAIAKLWRPAVRYKITTRLGLRKALLLWLVAGGVLFAIEGTSILPTLNEQHGLRDLLVEWVPHWDEWGVPETIPALPLALVMLAVAIILARPRSVAASTPAVGVTNRVTRLLVATPLIAAGFAAEVGLVPYVQVLGETTVALVSLILVAASVLFAGSALGTRKRERREDSAGDSPRARSSHRAVAMTFAMAAGVVVVHALLVWAVKDDRELAWATFIVDACLCFLGALIIWFGIDRIAKWAIGETIWNAPVVISALIRGLPVLLVFLGFFGVVEEVWKIAEREELATFLKLTGVMAALTILYLVLDAFQEVRSGCRFTRWTDVHAAANASARPWRPSLDEPPPGLLDQAPRSGSVPRLHLTPGQWANAVLVVLAYEAIVFIPVALACFLLFYELGHLVVDPGLFYSGDEVARRTLEWHSAAFEDRPWTKVAILMSGFAVLYLAVHVTGREQREQFLKVPDRELRRCLAVVAAYRRLRPPVLVVETRTPIAAGRAVGGGAGAESGQDAKDALAMDPGASVQS